MTFPAVLFGAILAALFASAFHFWRGDSLKKTLLYLLLAEIGFWGGHFLGMALGWKLILIGPLNAGMGTMGAVLILVIGSWLSKVEIHQK
jgi:hypothetical protein